MSWLPYVGIMYGCCETCIFFLPIFSCLLFVLNIRVGDESKSSVLWKIQSEIQINGLFFFFYCDDIHYQGCLGA